jgi:hypothetical protein
MLKKQTKTRSCKELHKIHILNRQFPKHGTITHQKHRTFTQQKHHTFTQQSIALLHDKSIALLYTTKSHTFTRQEYRTFTQQKYHSLQCSNCAFYTKRNPRFGRWISQQLNAKLHNKSAMFLYTFLRAFTQKSTLLVIKDTMPARQPLW